MLPASSMGFWSAYWTSLKPLEVEEPIDVWFHRPMGYVIAKIAYPTRITPNQITFGSIVFGLLSGVFFIWNDSWGRFAGAGCLLASIACDCADGQLARMRKSSSAFGRMLDGVADLVTAASVLTGLIFQLIRRYQSSPTLCAFLLILAFLTIYTGSFHTAGYDHYKNVFLRMTLSGSKEGEDPSDAKLRFETAKAQGMKLYERISFHIYLFYLNGQIQFLRWFDPFTTMNLNTLPSYSVSNANIYQTYLAGAMRLWRSLFGFGTLTFGLTLFGALARPDLFILIRLFGFNFIFFFILRPLQKNGSQRAFEEIKRKTDL